MALKVKLWGSVIGLMTWNRERSIATFQFTDEYMDSPFDISPIKHNKARRGARSFYGNPDKKYQGLPEFIADSLPDNWGNTLFDQWLRDNRIPATKADPLLKLSFIGKRGMGALEFEPERENDGAELTVDLDSLHRLSMKILKERENAVLTNTEKKTMQDLILLGGSAGGMHPKALVAYSRKRNEFRSGQVELPEDFRYYIVKFKEDDNIPVCELEQIFYEMATEAGITMMPSGLVTVEGNRHFITERFDRQGGQKIFTQSLAAVSPGTLDYTNIFFACETLGVPHDQQEELYRRMVFNFVSGVSDDHDKNFKFIMDRNGKWSLSPAFDMAFTSNIWASAAADIHCMGVNMKKSYLTMQDFIAFGEFMEMEHPRQTVEEICETVSTFRKKCEKHDIAPEWTDKIEDVIRKQFPHECSHLFQTKQKQPEKTVKKKRKGPRMG